MPRAEIAHKQALYTLAKLYGELAGKLRRAKDKAPIRANIEHVAATILLLDPAYDLASIQPVERYKHNPLFARGECFPAALAVLRRSQMPLTSKEIATRLLQERGITLPDRKMVRHMVGAVHTSFRNHAGGMIIAVGSKPQRWLLRA
ncbi:MAG TPA: hypothetical protein VN668_17120 [Stellaceae bacterium]|nr:hypothetical protein [Stellaceae bacterium]